MSGRGRPTYLIFKQISRITKKQGNLTPDDQPLDETDEAIEIIDVSEYKPDASRQNNGASVSKRSMRQTLCAVQEQTGTDTILFGTMFEG